MSIIIYIPLIASYITYIQYCIPCTALPPTFRGDERARQLYYMNVPLINVHSLESLPSCTGNTLSTYITCEYDVILGDGETVPFPPDLNNSSYFEYFLAWKRDSEYPFIDFDLSEITPGVSAIELTLLNSPANRISLPDIELYWVKGPLSASEIESSIISTILDNQDLAQTDNQVRTITIRLETMQTGFNLRIRFQFKDFHNFDWVFVSEVRFCTDPQPTFQPKVIFHSPKPDNVIVHPSADDLSRGSKELRCTISSEGMYTWQWKRNGSVITSDGDYKITTGDGSRTTKLTINNLNFSDTGEYKCTATIVDFSETKHSASKQHVVTFPGKYFSW